jgi:O-antigen/teichoic acid export membrane protein
MGVIKRQSIKQSIVVYLSLAAGALNMLLLFPAALNADQIGLITVIREAAFVFVPLVFLGGGELAVRFFPIFNNEERGHQGFLFFLSCLVAVGLLLLLLLFFPFQGAILDYYGQRSSLFQDYLYYLLPLTAYLSLATMLTMYVSNFRRIALPAVFNELLPKAGLSLLLLLLWAGLLSFNAVFQWYVWLHLLAVVGLVLYIIKLGQWHIRPDFSLFDKPLVKNMTAYSIYGMVGNFGYSLANRIDLMMLASLSTLTKTGVYSIAYFIASTFEVPRKAISKVASPLLAEYWHTGKKQEIQELYRKSALNQLIFGIGLFVSIWVSVDDLYDFMPNGDAFRSGKYVILLLSSARLFDLATGLNSEIISYSGYYRYNLYLYAIPVFISIVGSYLLIPHYQMEGAAMAVVLASIFYNISKFLLIRWRMQMNPFDKQFLWVIVLGFIACAVGLLVPSTDFPLISMILKSGTALVVFGSLVWKFNVSPDISTIIDSVWNRFFNKK